ncbi:vWA domain-containing protein [Paenibacillus massiliensis]|uniref:vWA domain-containing protein n=1 Tax=Paenibacillus massiliensis TaxID=225917 RepID=UPI00046F1AA7|nr:VWA domain-containing protein [Paenibacillus massiliensis]
MTKRSKFFLVSGLLLVLVFGLVYTGLSFFNSLSGKSGAQLNMEQASRKLNKMYTSIAPTTAEPIKGQIDLDPVNLADSLPDISKFEVTVENTTPQYVEIFSSTEKSGTGVDGWLVGVANDFNKSKIMVNGKPVSVKIRNIASGTATDYIKSGKYIPGGFTPSSELWGEMVKASNIKTELISKRLVGNVPGIVISKNKYDSLKSTYGEVNVQTVIEAINKNELAMGYTDPFASSTGLNFLITALKSFDGANPLGPEAVKRFEQFQANVPFTASTTLQMRGAAQSGRLDAFVLEYQTFVNTPELQGGYVFTPFGVRHDSPLYALGELPQQKLDILRRFSEFVKQEKYQTSAQKSGFNGKSDYVSPSDQVDGGTLLAAQKVWKEKKNSARPIAAVFVTDVSGSMNGEPLNKLKKSLIQGQKNLGADNSIGLVSYSSAVTIQLPLAKYDTNQQSMFAGSVESLSAGGGTATFDGVVVGLKMLEDYMAANPNVKPLLFVLSDGETNEGHSLKEIRELIEAYKVPIYTIGYNADLDALESISSINEAASINADTDDVVYKISNLFNVQM